MKNKKALALALASVTMAGAAVTAYSAITAPSVHAEEFVRKTEWVTISNDRSRTRTTVYHEAGDQKIDLHKYIDKFEYQNTYVEGGVRYYVFVEKGTKLDELENDPNTASADLNKQGYKSTDKNNSWREVSGNRYFYSHGNPVKGWVMIDNKTYYFNSEGVMARGIIENNSERYYLDNQGIKRTGFIKVGEKTYYFDANGVRRTEVVTENGQSHFVKDGVVTNGVQKVGTKWYFFDEKGKAQSGIVKDSAGKWYY
ncbi:MAG: nucleoside triphosphate hydrolase, partial [Streptococcus mitis]|nr:nucleoside triphosphate hydrolase [Streptococcus mitis]